MILTERKLIQVLEWAFPDSKDTVDFMVGTKTHTKGREIPKEEREPGIWSWSRVEPLPTSHDIEDFFSKWLESPDYEEYLKETVRKERDELLLAVDTLVNKRLLWEEHSQEQKEAIKEYRKLLLEVPQQEGFPKDIEWPEKPIIVDWVDS